MHFGAVLFFILTVQLIVCRMESEHVVCVICNKESDEKTVKFTSTTLDKSKLILKIRKDNNLKFNDISLPEEVNANTGYHVQCYKNFLAVMKKYRMSELPSSSNLSASSSGIYYELLLLCIFYYVYYLIKDIFVLIT